jgi:hypothetical protein
MAGVERGTEVEGGSDDSPGARLRLKRALRLPAVVCVWVCLLLAVALASAGAASAETGISGHVTAAVTKAPIAGIEVCAVHLSAQSGSEEPLVPEPRHCTSTNVSGDYVIAGLESGEYEVEFSSSPSSGLNYVTQYYDAKSSFIEATPVKVVAGQTTAEIDAEMTEGGKISGEVTGALTGSPIGEIIVCVFSTNITAGGSRCGLTESSGKYTISALSAGEYEVEFFAKFNENYVPQYYNGASTPETATPVAVAAGRTTAEINARLVAGARITGRVAVAATGVPIKGAEVCALVSFNEPAGCEVTNADGEYTISRLPAGSYAVKFNAEPNYPVQYYSTRSTFSAAERVTVATGAIATGINAALGPPPPPPPPSPPALEQSEPEPEPENEVQPSRTASTSVLSHTGSTVSVRDGDASVKVVCAGPKSCRGKLTLFAAQIVKIKGKRKARTVAIGAATVSLHAGATATVKIALNATGRQLLAAAHGRLDAHLSILQLEPAPNKTRTGAVQLVVVKAHTGKR